MTPSPVDEKMEFTYIQDDLEVSRSEAEQIFTPVSQDLELNASQLEEIVGS